MLHKIAKTSIFVSDNFWHPAEDRIGIQKSLLDWSRYHRLHGIYQYMQTLASIHPNVMKVLYHIWSRISELALIKKGYVFYYICLLFYLSVSKRLYQSEKVSSKGICS